MPPTAKPPWVGPIALACRVNIPLHLPADREKVIVILGGKRPKSVLNPMVVSRGVIMGMMALGVCQAQPLAKSPHFLVDLRADHQMPAIGQETIRQQFDWRAFQRFDYQPLKSLEVVRFMKGRFAPTAQG